MRRTIFAVAALLAVLSVARPAGSDETGLARHGIEPTTASVKAYLDSVVAEAPTRRQFAQWIEELGAPTFQRRAAATRKLLAAPAPDLELLDAAAKKSAAAEVRHRASRILERIRKRPPGVRGGVSLDRVFALVVQHRISDLAAPLLAVLPTCRSERLQSHCRDALAATVANKDVETLRRALGSESPAVREAALAVLAKLPGDRNAAGVDVAQVVIAEAVRLLGDPVAGVRLVAAHALAERGDRRALAALVDLLAADQMRVRSKSSRILRYFTGQSFGFSAADEPAVRVAAIGKWQNWVKVDGGGAQLHFPIKKLEVDPTGLVLHLTFSGGGPRALDGSGKANHGTLRNARFTQDGRAGSGCYLDGNGDYVTIPNTDALEIRDRLTLAVWVKLDSFAPGGYGNEEGHILKKGDPGWWNPSYGLGYRKNSRKAKFVVGHPGRPISRGGADLYSEAQLVPGRWHHIAGTYDGQTARLYVDGRLDVEKAYQGALRGDRAPVMIGGGKLFSTTAFANHFAVKGTVDDVRIYRRALTADEIVTLCDD